MRYHNNYSYKENTYNHIYMLKKNLLLYNTATVYTLNHVHSIIQE